MIPGLSNAPLFEARLELHEPELVFTPSLDSNTEGNFCSIIQGIIKEIIELSKLMPRIYNENNARDYFVSKKYLIFIIELRQLLHLGRNEFQHRHLRHERGYYEYSNSSNRRGAN